MNFRMFGVLALILSTAGLLLVGMTVNGLGFGRESLRLVTIICVNFSALTNMPFPCSRLSVDGRSGKRAVLVEVPSRMGHFLVVPTEKIEGLESTKLLENGTGRYWILAIEARATIVAAMSRKVPVSELGIAINSKQSRTQDQLHFHIACVKPFILSQLTMLRSQISDQLRPLPVPISGIRFWARRVAISDIESKNLFQSVQSAQSVDHSLDQISAALISYSNGRTGEEFTLLVNAGPKSETEFLLEHNCSERSLTK